jgi:hypothetical protein
VVQYFDVYTGGAHGNSTQYAGTYDLKTGKKLTLADQFEAGSNYKARLMTLIGFQSKGIARIQSNITGKKVAPIAPKTITGNEKYFIDGKDASIVVFYNPGEIAPISEGVTGILLWRRHYRRHHETVKLAASFDRPAQIWRGSLTSRYKFLIALLFLGQRYFCACIRTGVCFCFHRRMLSQWLTTGSRYRMAVAASSTRNTPECCFSGWRSCSAQVLWVLRDGDGGLLKLYSDQTGRSDGGNKNIPVWA